MVAVWYVGLHAAESVGRQLTSEIEKVSQWRKNKTTVLSSNMDVEPGGPTQP